VDISHESLKKKGGGEHISKKVEKIEHTITILLHKTPPPYFSVRISLNYEILSEMIFKCVLHRVLGYPEFPH
jgi:hypothetical protein